MDNENKNDGKKTNINLKVDPGQEQGIFTNAISLHVTHNEVTIDFGFLLPGQQNPVTIKLASRVNMTHQTAESLMNVLSNAILDWRNKQKKAKNNEQSKE
jgi:uncharacterized protein DUF3467